MGTWKSFVAIGDSFTEGVGFDEAGGYNQADAEGFIKLNALRLRILAERDKKRGKNE